MRTLIDTRRGVTHSAVNPTLKPIDYDNKGVT
jgi:hypothetical protein